MLISQPIKSWPQQDLTTQKPLHDEIGCRVPLRPLRIKSLALYSSKGVQSLSELGF